MSHKRTKEREERERVKLNGWDHLDRSFYTVNYFSDDDLRDRGISGEVKRINNMGGLTLGNWNAIEQKYGYVVIMSTENLSTLQIDLSGLKRLNDISEENKHDLLAMFEDAKNKSKRFLGFWYDKDKKEVVLDEVVVVPDLEAAILKAIYRNKDVIYDLKNQKDIPKSEFAKILEETK
ncbi:hypothetical protein [Mycoplasma phocoeninasale]|uniref:hypothetical protein n=1 Tax=Mycoplasma phocoeninasale TaxID=2726117 RepID=UPI001966E068|nr:hypothetical protein [Mycoplasma phocoeninasale]MBN0970487.1 hypothetical protein [Mycoplasma phocoeninasale]